jgi:multimeric flavodoxin WrbA/putative sterol carrier protein
MKILAVNGSPRGNKGNTEVILQAFLRGAHEEGAESEVIYLKDKTIHHCLGCFTCWIKTPGVCVHKDDMPGIIEQMKSADLMAYVMPLYVYTVPGLFKDFLDRLIPFAQPFIDKRGDHFIHPPRYGHGLHRSVIISNAGFPESHHFDGLKQTFRLLTDGPDQELLGMICCAGGPLLHIPEFENEVSWYLEASEKAGREVVSEGRILPETQAVLDRPLAPDPAVYADMTNAYWASLGIERIEVDRAASENMETGPKGQGETKLAPPSEVKTIRDLIAGMPGALNAEAAGDLETVVQFDIKDEDPGDYYLTISKGICEAYAGVHPEPAITVHTPAEVWMKIAQGEMSGATAFMTGKFKVSGKLDLLMKLGSLFTPKT